MTALNKQALREAAVNAKIAGEAPVMPFDQRIDALNSFTKLLTPATAIALLDENESLVRANSAQDDHINQQQDRIDRLERGSHEAAKQISSWRRIAKQNIAEREKDIAELCASRQRMAGLEDDVRNIIELLEGNDWSKYCTHTDLGKRLEVEVTLLIGNLRALSAAGAKQMRECKA